MLSKPPIVPAGPAGWMVDVISVLVVGGTGAVRPRLSAIGGSIDDVSLKVRKTVAVESENATGYLESWSDLECR